MNWVNNFDSCIKDVFLKENILDSNNEKINKVFRELKNLKKSGDKYKFIENAKREEGKNSIKDIYNKIYDYASKYNDLLLKDSTKIENLIENNYYTKLEISAVSNFWNHQTGILFDKKSNNVFITVNTKDDYNYKINGMEVKVKNIIYKDLSIKYYAQSNSRSSSSIYNSTANNELRNKVGNASNNENSGFIFVFETVGQNEYKYIGKYITKKEVIEKHDVITKNKIIEKNKEIQKEQKVTLSLLCFELVKYEKLSAIEKSDILKYSEFNNIKNFESIINDEIPSTEIEEKRALVKVRWQQGKWRKELMNKYNNSCVLTNIKHNDLLIASHIKPYNKCKKDEACDIENGLLLSALADKLFDKELMSFDEEGKIIFSKELKDNNDLLKIQEHIDLNFKLIMTEKMRSYMKYHYKNQFIDNKK